MMAYHCLGSRKIRFGLPKGNLNKPEDNRGYTKLLFDLAGYHIKGYEPGKEDPMPRVSELDSTVEFYCMKPKQLPLLLAEGAIDMAILGRDTIEERAARLWQDTKWDGNQEVTRKFAEAYIALSEAESQKSFESEVKKRMRVSKIPGLKETPYEKIIQEQLERLNELNDGRMEKFAKLTAQFNDRLDKPVTAYEKSLSEYLFLLTNLGYGRVDVRWGLPLKTQDRLTRPFSLVGLNISSAYPNLTYREIARQVPASLISLKQEAKSKRNSLSRSLIETLGENLFKKVETNIFPFTSNTETMIRLGLADLIVDSVSTGTSFQKSGLVSVGNPILENSTAQLIISFNAARDYTLSKRREGRKVDIFRRIDAITKRLHAASLEYGKTRPDSVYYQGGKR